jgi:hypothetical protein
MLVLAGCTTMRPVRRPANYIESVQPKLIRVTGHDGTRVLMTGAHLEGDTLMGFVARPGGAMGEFTEMSLRDVTMVEAQQYAGWKTAAAISGGLAAWAVITFAFVKYIEASN